MMDKKSDGAVGFGVPLPVRRMGCGHAGPQQGIFDYDEGGDVTYLNGMRVIGAGLEAWK